MKAIIYQSKWQLFTQSMENLVSVQGNSTIGLNGVLLKGVGAIE